MGASDSDSEYDSGRRTSSTEAMKRDGIWDNKEEHLSECQGHNLNNFKKNMYKKLDDLLVDGRYQGMFISKLIYIKFI